MVPDEIFGFRELQSRYHELLRRFADRLWGFIEIDLGGVDSKRRLRAETEAQGFVPIPVYHPLVDGWDYFDELAAQYDRICIGNTAHEPAIIRKRIIATIDHRRRKYPTLKWIHVLGVRPNEWMRGMYFNSADSSSWTQPLRFGVFPEFADGKRFGNLPSSINYIYGEDRGGDSGITKAVSIAMISAHHVQVAWRNRQLDWPVRGDL